MLALVAVYFGAIVVLVIGLTIGTASWRWPVAVLAAIGVGLVSVLLFSRVEGVTGSLGLAAIAQLTMYFAVFAAVYSAGLFWWFRR